MPEPVQLIQGDGGLPQSLLEPRRGTSSAATAFGFQRACSLVSLKSSSAAKNHVSGVCRQSAMYGGTWSRYAAVARTQTTVGVKGSPTWYLKRGAKGAPGSQRSDGTKE